MSVWICIQWKITLLLRRYIIIKYKLLNITHMTFANYSYIWCRKPFFEYNDLSNAYIYILKLFENQTIYTNRCPRVPSPGDFRAPSGSLYVLLLFLLLLM